MSEAQTQIFFHGLKLLAVIVLSLIVVFRRQMSCNSVYVDDDDDENDECADSYSGKRRRKIVCPGREENRDSTNRERVCQSNKRIHYALLNRSNRSEESKRSFVMLLLKS